jgi:hypothetical protein
MNVRLQKTLTFTSGVWYNNTEHLQMNNYTVRVHLHTNTSNTADQNIAFGRMKYFVYYEMDSGIFINQEPKEKCLQLLSSGLSVITMPTDPVDQMIGIMLYYKLNAIMEQRLIVTEVEIESCFGENLVYLHHEDEDTTDIVRPKWWDTADLLHCDAELIQQDKVVAINHTRNWRELDLAWADNTSSTSSGNVVVFADFKRDDTE